jgi:hypothetical protein
MASYGDRRISPSPCCCEWGVPKPTVQLGDRRHRPKAISRAPPRARARFAAPLGSHPPIDKEHDPASLKFQSAARRRSLSRSAYRCDWGGISMAPADGRDPDQPIRPFLESPRAGSPPGNVGRTGASLSEFGAEVSRHAVTRLVAEDHRIEPTRSVWSCRPSRVGCSQIRTNIATKFLCLCWAGIGSPLL